MGIDPGNWNFSNSSSIPIALYQRIRFILSSNSPFNNFWKIITIDFDFQNNVLKYSLKNSKR